MERKARWCAAQLRGELYEAASVGAATAAAQGRRAGINVDNWRCEQYCTESKSRSCGHDESPKARTLGIVAPSDEVWEG
jgi:hypothetical protein